MYGLYFSKLCPFAAFLVVITTPPSPGPEKPARVAATHRGRLSHSMQARFWTTEGMEIKYNQTYRWLELDQQPMRHTGVTEGVVVQNKCHTRPDQLALPGTSELVHPGGPHGNPGSTHGRTNSGAFRSVPFMGFRLVRGSTFTRVLAPTRSTSPIRPSLSPPRSGIHANCGTSYDGWWFRAVDRRRGSERGVRCLFSCFGFSPIPSDGINRWVGGLDLWTVR